MAIICKACESKDSEIKFLRTLVKDFTTPLAPVNQVWNPSYTNDMGEQVTPSDEVIEVEGIVKNPDTGEEEKVVQEVNIVNEVLGH